MSARTVHFFHGVGGLREPEGPELRRGPQRTVTDPTDFEKFKEVDMLVLSRKLNEKIVIDGGIVITVVKIDRNQVRIGIEAPGHVGVFREEIYPGVKVGHESLAETVTAGS